MGHSHLTDDERNDIYLLKAQGMTLTSIGDRLGRNKSTISRELSRNSGLRGYRPRQAHQKALARRHVGRGGTEVSPSTWAFCRQLIEAGYSPQQAAGRAKKMGQGMVSHKYTYRRIYEGKQVGDPLWRHLRCQKNVANKMAQGAPDAAVSPTEQELNTDVRV